MLLFSPERLCWLKSFQKEPAALLCCQCCQSFFVVKCQLDHTTKTSSGQNADPQTKDGVCFTVMWSKKVWIVTNTDKGNAPHAKRQSTCGNTDATCNQARRKLKMTPTPPLKSILCSFTSTSKTDKTRAITYQICCVPKWIRTTNNSPFRVKGVWKSYWPGFMT